MGRGKGYKVDKKTREKTSMIVCMRCFQRRPQYAKGMCKDCYNVANRKANKAKKTKPVIEPLRFVRAAKNRAGVWSR